MATLPRIVLRIASTWPSRAGVVARLEAEGRPLREGFELRVDPGRAATLVSPPARRDDAAEVALLALRTASALIDLGGRTVHCLSSGAVHSPRGWQALATEARRAFADSPTARTAAETIEAAARLRFDLSRALASAYVRLPVAAANGDLHTCGAHVLGRPDAIVARADCEGLDEKAEVEAARLLDAFLLYQLAECGADDLRGGDTFRRFEAAPRYRLAAEPCSRFATDDPRWNPFGYYRLRLVERSVRSGQPG